MFLQLDYLVVLHDLIVVVVVVVVGVTGRPRRNDMSDGPERCCRVAQREIKNYPCSHISRPALVRSLTHRI